MKIYEIGTGYAPIPAKIGAATEIVVEELTRAFLKQGKRVQIIDIAADDRAETDLPILEVPVPRCFQGTDVKLGLLHKLKRVVYSVCLAGVLRKQLKKESEKVVLHFHNQYNLFFFLKLLPRREREKAVVAYTNHSHVWHGEWENIEDIIKRRYFQEVYSMKYADCVFVLNEKTMCHLSEHCGIKKEKITLIDNGVNTSIYRRLEPIAKKKILMKYGLQDKTVLIQVGSVCARKNQLETLNLLMPFIKKNENIVFCYAGAVISDEYQQKIQDIARENGVENQVRYFGELTPGEELNEFYNLATAMVFPSKAEGFSLVILEAMAAGVPVMINNHLQFRLAKNCLKFENEQEFQNILYNEILCQEKKEMHSATAICAVESAYGWNIVAQEYLLSWVNYLG